MHVTWKAPTWNCWVSVTKEADGSGNGHMQPAGRLAACDGQRFARSVVFMIWALGFEVQYIWLLDEVLHPRVLKFLHSYKLWGLSDASTVPI